MADSKTEAPSDGLAALKNIRAKYPQHADMKDQELASAIVKKYPAYKDVLGDIAAPVSWRGEKPSFISAPKPPPAPKAGTLNPHPDPLGEALTNGRRPQDLTVGGVVGPLAVMAAPVLAGAAGPAAGAAKQGAKALNDWARANPVQAYALIEVLKASGLGGLTKYLHLPFGKE
jgi:hypothetical protein